MSAKIGHPWVDESGESVYRVCFPATASEEELLEYCRAVESWWPKVDEPVAFIVDARSVKTTSPRQREILAIHERKNQPYTARFMACSALVVSNQIVRGMVTAVYWMAPPNYPHKVTTRIEDAETWVNKQLARQQDQSNR